MPCWRNTFPGWEPPPCVNSCACAESMELFKLCRIYIQACMQRRESGRAMYRRADYPDLDPALEKCLVTRLDESGNPVFQWNS